MYRIDLRHPGATPDGEAARGALPLGAEHRDRRALAFPGGAQHPGALPSSIPLFLAQGTTDDIVRPEVTASYMQRQCKAGSKVRMMWVQGVGHGFVARDSADAAVSWMMDRFAGRPAPTDCGKPLSSTADAQSPAQ